MDWQVGDLAVCVDDSPCRRVPYPGAPWDIPAGAVCRVTGLGLTKEGVGVSLFFDDYRSKYHDNGYGFTSKRFRKILPDKHEQCEPEFVTLLKRSKRKVSA